MNETSATKPEKVGLFQIVVLILSIVVLGALGADAAFKLPKQISHVLQTLDHGLSLVFNHGLHGFSRIKTKATGDSFVFIRVIRGQTGSWF